MITVSAKIWFIDLPDIDLGEVFTGTGASKESAMAQIEKQVLRKYPEALNVKLREIKDSENE